MSLFCPDNQIYDFRKKKIPNAVPCVDINSTDGQFIMNEKNKCHLDEAKIYNEETGNCVMLKHKTGNNIMKSLKQKQVYDIYRSNSTVSPPVATVSPPVATVSKTSQCNKGLNSDIIYQCRCSICWIVSSIVSIKYSGLEAFLNPSYVNMLNNLYNLFTSDQDYVCPEIIEEIIDVYWKELYPKQVRTIGAREIFKEGGSDYIFMYAFLKLGLLKKYNVVWVKEKDDLNYSKFDKDTVLILHRSIINNSIIIKQQMVDVILKVFQSTKKFFLNKGYCFRTGTMLITRQTTKTRHSVCWKYCNDTLYICNSTKNPCFDIKNEVISGPAFFEVYSRILAINFILTRI